MTKEQLKKRNEMLNKLIAKTKKEIPKFPEGHIRVVKKRKIAQYYLITEKADTQGKYLKKNQRKIAEEIAQKDYLKKLLKESERESKAITAFLNGMDGIRPEDVYDSLGDFRKILVSPSLVSDEEYASNWIKNISPNPAFYPEELIYDTKRGDIVRSKSEALLADMYYDMGIPYLYEYPLTLSNGKQKIPDFTLLKLPERKIIYHEHLGLLEDEDYLRNNLIKLQEYASSGIYPGNNLILTFETSYCPLNIKTIKNMIKEIWATQSF